MWVAWYKGVSATKAAYCDQTCVESEGKLTLRERVRNGAGDNVGGKRGGKQVKSGGSDDEGQGQRPMSRTMEAVSTS